MKDGLENGVKLNAGSSSRLPGFYQLPMAERLNLVGRFSDLTGNELDALGRHGSLSPDMTDVFIENGVGTFELPLGVATNFYVNGKDVLVPMAVEESSVLAAASHGAKLARQGGGFTTSSTEPVMTGEIQLFVDDSYDFNEILRPKVKEMLAVANSGHERLVGRGGGARALNWRYIKEIRSLVIYLDVDTRDAMGANIVNTMCERLSGFIAKFFECDIGLRILTNLTDKRVARAQCRVLASSFDSKQFKGHDVVARIEQAYLFAAHDVYRAATHNKGVMNGIDPVLIATGNDWRAVEAGAHAYSCRTGVYQPMTKWWQNTDGDLEGSIELPMAVGTVGGVTKLHPTAKAALRLMGSPDAKGLAEIVCAVGLAQNLSALRALASEGIQKGHMSLHQKNITLSNSKEVH